jgi:hypothetical protein
MIEGAAKSKTVYLFLEPLSATLVESRLFVLRQLDLGSVRTLLKR